MKTIVATFVALAALGGTSVNAQTVAVTGGQIHGAMLDKGGAVFKGIPFAAPPVGELRWREPMPVRPWRGVREAAAFGAPCAQLPSNQEPNAAKEDCLFLNVWAPEWPSRSRKPVMVWIHGGGNFVGSSSQSFPIPVAYDGESLARHGVVLVSLNYRLGPFGFFSHPALTRESPNHASGNQGILDQIAALKWVRDNIAKFGGDPNNVTIFGESAGSLDVSVLMTSPLSKGLFHRAISESGPVPMPIVGIGEPVMLAQAEKRGEMQAVGWKLPPTASANDLRAVSVDEILKMQPNFNAPGADVVRDFPALGITIDDYVFPKNPAGVFATGQEHRVDLLNGSNSREIIPGTFPPKDLREAIEETYGPLAERAQALYVGDRDPLYGTPAEQWATDTTLRCTAVAQSLWHATARNPTFEYEFIRVPVGREALGVTHAAELSYVFGATDRGIRGVGGPLVPGNAVDRQVAEVVQQYWTNFAKTGDPNGAGLPVWPKFDSTSRAYIQFTDAGPIAKEGLRRPYCDLFIENVKRQMTN